MPCIGFIYIPLLPSLCSTTEQDNERLAIPGEVDAISWPPVDDVLTNAIEPVDARCVAKSQSGLGRRHLGGGLCSEVVKPSPVGISAVFAKVFFKRHLLDLHGNTYVTIGRIDLHFGSACHGAGRGMSRHAALLRYGGQHVAHQLEARGILVRSPSMRGVAEEAPGAYKEAPGAYKEVTEVVEAADKAGLARTVARLEPRICIKG